MWTGVSIERATPPTAVSFLAISAGIACVVAAVARGKNTARRASETFQQLPITFPSLPKQIANTNSNAAALRLSLAETVCGVDAFLKDANALQAKCKRQDDAIVSAALSKFEEQFAKQAAEVYQIITSVSSGESGLTAILDAGEAPPEEHLTALNAALEGCLPSEMIPAKLAEAKPGGKKFEGLLQKVRKVCSFDEATLNSKLRALTEFALRKGSGDSELASARKALEKDLATDLLKNAEKHARALAQSDHPPIYHTVQLSKDRSLDVMSWNTLEFPQLVRGAQHASSEVVCDGIAPSCRVLLQILKKKGKDQQEFLMNAMSSQQVIATHVELILQEVRHALAERKVEVVLLQEVSTAVQDQLMQQSQIYGWHVHFAQANSDLKKCDAITCVISLRAFDETAEFECLEGKKPRFFAAVRQGPVWIVSCHVPVEVLTKEQKKEGVPTHGNAVKATRTFERIVSRFLAEGSSADILVLGGDFNTDVQILKSNLTTKSCCSQVGLEAPDAATCFDVEWPIDGIFTAFR